MIKDIKIFIGLLSYKNKVNIINLFIIIFILTLFEFLGFSVAVPLILFIMNPNFINDFKNLININFLNTFTMDQVFNFFLIIVIFVYLIKSLIEFFFLRKKNIFFFEIMENISVSLFRSYIYRPYSYFLKKDKSEIISNISVIIPDIIYNFLIPLISLLVDVLLIFIIFLFLIIVNPKIIIFLFSFFLFGFLLFYNLKKKLEYFGKIRVEGESSKTLCIQQSFLPIKENIIFDRLSFFEYKFQSIFSQIKKIFIKYYTCLELPKVFLETIGVTFIILVIFFLKFFNLSNEDLALTITALALSSYKILPCFNRIIINLQKIKFSSFLVNNIASEQYNSKLLKNNQNRFVPVKNFSFSRSIILKNVDFKYNDKEDFIFKNLNFEINFKDCIGIFGPSGSGKSTLVDLISGLLIPTKGNILVDGINISSNLRGWQNNIGYVPQVIHLINESLINNILMGNDYIEKNVNEVLKTSKLENIEFLNKDTVLGDDGVRISGGQKQRVGIARALYRQSSFLIFDEATSALDDKTEKEIIEFISSLSSTKTIIIITHNIKILDICNKIYKIKNKGLLEINI